MARTIRYDWFHWLNNTLEGDGTDEEFRGGDGNDKIYGSFGDDLLLGQDGHDILLGEEGADDVRGGDGNDTLSGGDLRTAFNASRDGRDTIDGGAGNDELFFSGADSYNGGSGIDTFDGRSLFLDTATPGVVSDDPLILKKVAAEGLRMDLEAGIAQQRGTGAATENFYSSGSFVAPAMGTGTASFSNIEIYQLTDFGDYFEGDDTADTIEGLGGNDIIEGKGGVDIIDGGSGTDTVEFGSSSARVIVDLNQGTGRGGDAEGDTYSSVENIRGSAFGDTLRGDDRANHIFGRAGNDIIEGFGGADTIDGGTGIDHVTYEASTGAVNVDLNRAVQQRGDAEGDTLTSVENVTGTDVDGDRLIGNSSNNFLDGKGGGADTVDGGYGDDILVGGDGTRDRVEFGSHDPVGLVISPTVNIDLTLGVATHTSTTYNLGRPIGTTTETDLLYGFEDVRGSNLSETIRGDNQVNFLEGRGGNDTLRGEGGGDLLNGGAGFDVLFGGSGNDAFTYHAASDATAFTTGGILALEQIADFQDIVGGDQDTIDLHLMRTTSNGRLFFNDGDNALFEQGELMVNTLADGRTYISADLTGDGNIDFAVSFNRQITTLDANDFLF